MRSLMPAVLVVVVLGLSFPAPATADHRDRELFGTMTAEGVVQSVSQSSSAFLLRVARPERLRRAASGHLVVWLQQGTDVRGRAGDGGDQRWDAAPRAFRAGDVVKVDGFRLDDGRLLAMRIDVRHRDVFFRPPDHGGNIVIQGVLIAKGAGLIIVVDGSGAARIILVATATIVSGRRNSVAALQPNDAVTIVGVMNADGAFAASEVRVSGAR